MESLQIVSGCACINGLILCGWLWRQEINREANRWCAVLVFVVALIYVDGVVYYSSKAIRIPVLAYCFQWLLFLLGPLCYHYVKVLTTKKPWPVKLLFLHSLPSLLAFLVLFIEFYMRPIQVQRQMLQNDQMNLPGFSLFDILDCVAVPQIIMYWGASVWAVRRYRKHVEKLVADIDPLRLNWLTKFLFIAALFMVVDALAAFSSWQPFEWMRVAFPALNVYGLAYLGLRQPEVFVSNAVAADRDRSPNLYSCFISYSTKDQLFADLLYSDLDANGVRCFFAPKDIRIGEKFRQRIDDEIRLRDKLLLVLSRASVHSSWVQTEVETAFRREQESGRTILFPIRLDDAIEKARQAWARDIYNQRQILDFRQWQDPDRYKIAFNRILRDLQATPVVPLQSPGIGESQNG